MIPGTHVFLDDDMVEHFLARLYFTNVNLAQPIFDGRPTNVQS